MKDYGQEIAKFFAGFAASETIGHWWLGLFGANLLPIKLGPLTLTSDFNIGAMALWPIVLALLVYIGWLRKAQNKVAPHSTVPMPV